jgi:delta8-fatty-acid desaturase
MSQQVTKTELNNESRKKKLVTRKEVSKHNTPNDCWIIIEEKVYNVPESWIKIHPGGRLTIMALAGKDATEPFLGNHDQWVIREKLKNYYFANLTPEDCTLDPMVKDFRELTKELQQKGYFNTNYWWYFRLALWLASLFISAWSLVLFQNSFIGHMLSAVFLGVYFQQIAFMGHDFCHNAFTHSRFYDNLLSTLLASIAGISCQWWKHTHNVHHIVTNSVEFDPDIQHLPVFAVTEKYFKSVYSIFHGRVMPFDYIAQMFVKYQHLLYYPIMSLSRVNLYLQGIILHLKSKDYIPSRYLDIFSIVFYFAWYSFLLYLLPTMERRILYFFISHCITGLLSVQITISHFAMPTYEDCVNEDFKYNFPKTQLGHSMDVDCAWWLDWLHGGLQFQVVHHLFPRIPRHNLRHVRDTYIIPFTNKWGLKYEICSFYEANVRVLGTLKETSKKLNSFLVSPKESQGLVEDSK